MRRGVWTVWLLAGCLGCAGPPLDQQILEQAAAALGGRDRVLAVEALTLEGTGTQYNLGQDMSPDASGQTFTISEYRRTIGFGAERVRTELTRRPDFLYFRGQAPERLVQGVDAETGYNVAAEGTPVRVTDEAAADRRVERLHHPLALVRAAFEPGASLDRARESNGERLVDIVTAAGQRLTLVVDGAGRPTRSESAAAHPNLGDVLLSTLLADYQDVGGLTLPARLTSKVDDFTTVDLRVARQALDEHPNEAAAPAGVPSTPATVPAPNVVPEEVAPGVWLLAGQSHHSALVELGDRLVLIDVPQSEARTRATLDRARQLRPDKPLDMLVLTHHHFDHSAGLRLAIAEGLTVVTHQGNRAWVEEMAARPHTIRPDALARAPRPVQIETFDDEQVIEDETRTLVLYHIDGNPHSDTMLMAHLPREGLLVQVDAYSPAAAVHPYAANLLENVTKRGLRVDRIVPLHGAVVPFAALEQAVAAGTR